VWFAHQKTKAACSPPYFFSSGPGKHLVVVYDLVLHALLSLAPLPSSCPPNTYLVVFTCLHFRCAVATVTTAQHSPALSSSLSAPPQNKAKDWQNPKASAGKDVLALLSLPHSHFFLPAEAR
jgi:hypothetical protein